MENLIFSLNATVPIFLLMILGLLFHKIGWIDDVFAQKMNKFVFVVPLPVLVFSDLATVDFHEVWNMKFVLFCFLATFHSITLVSFMSLGLKERALRGEFIQASYRSSAALLGIAFIQNIYGNAGMAPVMIIGSVPLYNIMAVLVLSLFKPGQSGLDKAVLKRTAKGIVTNPIILGIVAGLLWSALGLKMPHIMQKTVTNIGGVATPMGLMAMGATFDIKKAFAKGEGEDIRKSDTIGEEMCYYAEKMPDGTVLRVSRTMNSAMKSAFHILPFMIFLALVMIVTAWLLSKWQIERLIRPINTLDLENPLEQEMYPELQPLLERIEQSNKAKEAVAAMRREFSANVSHELKTPLTSISGYAEIMKDGLVRPEDMQHFSEKIYQEASRLITLVEDIIKLSRLDEGRVELEKEEVDLYELSREIVSRLAPQAVKNRVRLELTGESVKYTGIRQILDEMIYNITENAIKYNNPGGKVSVWAGNTLQGKKVVVTDNGIGIPEDQIDRIFERFYRVDKSHSKERGGTGLGLSIVKHGVMLHHGEVHVESKLGEGTRIELVFP